MKLKNRLTLLTLFLFFGLIAVPMVISANTPKKTSFDTDPNWPTLIELLQNGESYSIEITSIGCFGGTRQTLIIYKEADAVMASFKDSSKVLTTMEIETLRVFEIQLRDLKTGGCTTVDTYVLQYGNEIYRTSDDSCSWFGYRKLLEIFA